MLFDSWLFLLSQYLIYSSIHTHRWSNFLHQIHQDKAMNTASISLDNENQPNTVSAVQSMNAALDYVAYINSLKGC